MLPSYDPIDERPIRGVIENIAHSEEDKEGDSDDELVKSFDGRRTDQKEVGLKRPT